MFPQDSKMSFRLSKMYPLHSNSCFLKEIIWILEALSRQERAVEGRGAAAAAGDQFGIDPAPEVQEDPADLRTLHRPNRGP